MLPVKTGKTIRKEEGFFALNYHHKSVDWDAIDARFSAMQWRQMLQSRPAQEMVEIIYQSLLEVCLEYIPKKLSQTRHHHIPRDRRILMRKRTKLQKQYHKSSLRARNRLKQEIEGIEASILGSHRKERLDKEKEAVKSIKHNP